MSFFDQFQYTTFTLPDNSETLVRDITRAVALKFDQADTQNLFSEYEVQDGEKIEHLAYRFYGSTEYHWVLMFINGILDPLNDLPQKDYVIRKACLSRFGSLDSLHHYENANNPGEWVDFLHTPGIPISNLEWMTKENEKKRRIRILRSEYLSEFVDLYMNQMKA